MIKRLALVLVAIMTSGCAALPVSGPVRIGPDLAPGVGVDSFYYSPSPPTPDSTQAEILSGFLSAGTGPQNDYSIAREYLSESFRATWNPNQEVLIQRGSPQITISEESTAQIEVDLIGRIDLDGRYEALPVGTTRLLEFSFVQESNQWRLDSAPDATVLIKPVFDVVFRSYSIYFLDREQRFLVPELRWFPLTPATGTKLVNSLLKGPSPWLKPAVTSAIPSGTRLSIDAVTVDQSTALVDLTARALVASRTDRSLMKAQLAATLSQLPNVQNVAISIERSRQDIPDGEPLERAIGLGPLLSLTAEGLEAATGFELGPFEDSLTFFEDISATEIALAPDQETLATLGRGGIYLTGLADIGSEVELVDARENLLPPTYDRQQYLWTLTSNVGSSMVALSPSGERVRVDSGQIANLAVESFDISPEGSRIAFVVRGSERNRLLLAAIVRDRSGVPVSISEPIELAQEVAGASQLRWIDAMNLALVSKASGIETLSLITLGGFSRNLSAPEGTRYVVATLSSQNLQLITDSNQLYALRANNWTLVRDGVIAITLAK